MSESDRKKMTKRSAIATLADRGTEAPVEGTQQVLDVDWPPRQRMWTLPSGMHAGEVAYAD